jgi:hypothetical protein
MSGRTTICFRNFLSFAAPSLLAGEAGWTPAFRARSSLQVDQASGAQGDRRRIPTALGDRQLTPTLSAPKRHYRLDQERSGRRNRSVHSASFPSSSWLDRRAASRGSSAARTLSRHRWSSTDRVPETVGSVTVLGRVRCQCTAFANLLAAEFFR